VVPPNSRQIHRSPHTVPEGRRILDLAEGVLIGLRRYPAEAAFREIVSVATSYGLSVSVVAAALVAQATGESDCAATQPAAVAVELAWSQLLSPGI
jgi:MFS superfamily sulfate permease-like transporter